MSDAAQQEYAEALAAYRAAQARLVEARQRLPETARDRRKRLKREEAARLTAQLREAPPDPRVEALLREARESATTWSSDFWLEYLRAQVFPDSDVGALLQSLKSDE